MAHDCRVTQRLKRRQRQMFRIAERDYDITQNEVHLATEMSRSAIGQYARGETAMSGPAILKLADWEDFPAELLSILFDGSGRVVHNESDGDHTEYAAHCIEFAGDYQKARHPESEAGTDIGPNEDRALRRKRRKA